MLSVSETQNGVVRPVARRPVRRQVSAGRQFEVRERDPGAQVQVSAHRHHHRFRRRRRPVGVRVLHFG